jgi:Family of unknown function (DUF5413)
MRSPGGVMKRFVVFAILGPCLAGMTMLLLALPVATWLEGVRVEASLSADQVLTAYLVSIFPALVVGLFDWIAAIIDVPYRPIGAAIVGWILAVVALRGFLAMPDLPGWFVAIGLIGGIPALICSWVTLKVTQKQSINA